MIVEGAGGLLVPLADDLMVADLAKDLGLPLIIVARPGLGTINHTLMTCECAISRGISILGFILNGQEENPGKAEAYASRLIAKFSGLPLLGVLGRYGGLAEKEIVTRMADALDREPLADALKGEIE